MNTNFITDKLRSATKTALDKVGKISGVENDANMRIYQSLQPDDFNAIMKKFGVDETMKYIQAMESKRMINGRKNG